MLFALLAGCGGSNNLVLTLPLEGTAYGLAVTPDDHLAVTHRNDAGDRHLSVYNRSSGTLVWSHSAGPGVPVVGDGRTYVLQDQGLVAFRGTAIDWQHDVDDLIPNDSGAGLTQEGVVVFGTTRNGAGTIHAVTHLGFPVWTTPVTGVPVGSPVTDGENNVYFTHASGDDLLLQAFDGEDGSVRFQLPGLTPVAALPVGLLATDGEETLRIREDGTILWRAPYAATSATLTGTAAAWVTSPQGMVRLDLDDGEELDSVSARCAPLVVDLLSDGWGLCTQGDGLPQLMSLDSISTAQGPMLGEGEAVDAPVLLTNIAYVLFNGTAPTLYGFRAPATTGDTPWPRSAGSATNDRRIQL